jgi:dimethylargininase
MTQHSLVRRPVPSLQNGLVSHIERRPVDFELAIRQWHGYVEALNEHGWATTEVLAATDCPDSVFIEDTMVVYRNVAIISRPGADSRKPEIVGAEKALIPFGYRVERIQDPGTLDGGDVLKVGNTIYVGQGGRTNAEGLRQLRAVFAPLGARVVAIPMSKVLHLKTAITALPDGSIIGWAAALDDPFFFPNFVPMPEEEGAHVVLLGDDRLLMSASAPRSAALLRDLGYHPVPVELTEFEKLEGCVTCLSVRLREAPMTPTG